MRYTSLLKAYQTPIFRQMEMKEEMGSMYRNLKLQFNILTEENLKLRTQAKQMDVEFLKQEKEFENLSKQMQ